MKVFSLKLKSHFLGVSSEYLKSILSDKEFLEYLNVQLSNRISESVAKKREVMKVPEIIQVFEIQYKNSILRRGVFIGLLIDDSDCNRLVIGSDDSRMTKNVYFPYGVLGIDEKGLGSLAEFCIVNILNSAEKVILEEEKRYLAKFLTGRTHLELLDYLLSSKDFQQIGGNVTPKGDVIHFSVKEQNLFKVNVEGEFIYQKDGKTLILSRAEAFEKFYVYRPCVCLREVIIKDKAVLTPESTYFVYQESDIPLLKIKASIQGPEISIALNELPLSAEENLKWQLVLKPLEHKF